MHVLLRILILGLTVRGKKGQYYHNYNLNDIYIQSASIHVRPIHGVLTHCLCSGDYVIKQPLIVNPLKGARVPIASASGARLNGIGAWITTRLGKYGYGLR